MSNIEKRITKLEGTRTDQKKLEEYIKFLNDVRGDDKPPLTLADFPEDYEIPSHEEALEELERN